MSFVISHLKVWEVVVLVFYMIAGRTIAASNTTLATVVQGSEFS